MIAWTPPRAEGLRTRARRAVGSLGSWRLAAPFALALALIASGGCALRAQPALRVGINAEPGYEFAYLAQVEGLFARHGVAVQLVQFESMSDSRRAFERGQLDGWFGTVFEVMQARVGSRRSPRIVRVLDCSQGFDVVLAGSGIRDVPQLAGRTIAIEPGSLNVYLLSRALEQHGMKLASVRMSAMDPGGMEAALRQGAVDAAVCYPPASSAIVASGLARPIFSSAEIPGEIVDVLAFDAAVLDRRAGDVDAFLRGYDDAVAWTAGHRDEAFRIMARREGITPAEFRESLDNGLELVSSSRQDAYFMPGGLLPRVVDSVSRLMVATGQTATPIPAADVIAPLRRR